MLQFVLRFFKLRWRAKSKPLWLAEDCRETGGKKRSTCVKRTSPVAENNQKGSKKCSCKPLEQDEDLKKDCAGRAHKQWEM